MEKAKLNINYATQKSVSFSQLSMFSQCEYQWYLAYLKKKKVFKPGIYLCFGTSLHETLQHYLDVMYNKSIVAANEIDLAQHLEDRMLENYKNDIENNNNEHYSTKEELMEFIADGAATLEWFKKNRAKYFSKKNTELVGIEIPVLQSVTEYSPNVLLQGYIDFILYHKGTDTYTIYDIKTSTRGWTEKEKKDQLKVSQLLLYKHFYSKALNIDQDKIDVRFFIVKRKVYENSEFPIARIQEFVPANKSKKVKDAYNLLENFVKECFTPEAKYNTERVYKKNLDACKWCQFNSSPDLCDRKE